MARSQRLAAAKEALRKKERAFIDTPDEWPRWPVLPVVMRQSNDPDDVGFVLAGSGPVVFFGNIYDIPKNRPLPATTKKVDYPDFESLLDVWRVD